MVIYMGADDSSEAQVIARQFGHVCVWTQTCPDANVSQYNETLLRPDGFASTKNKQTRLRLYVEPCITVAWRLCDEGYEFNLIISMATRLCISTSHVYV